ncbi:acyltransferase family protein [Chitinophaga japonensis]|uniref:Peptidoglycan/LPS O-acetylase OafA/YrhL n=1 Tax=Chitinophaga japonensis TaxID=104662 RepID=A0A562TFM4_CHIJA|nr:acyltransferase [Chitinophaga japonensis]TWI92339.1 peptidoglycan/LPS O-acetylase OafA/YrhL [Chitinophaga japonensis]
MKNLDTTFLNGLRFVLALWVALGHFYKYIGGAAFVKIPVLGNILMTNGPAVDGFMVITGFLMMYQYLKREEEEPPSEAGTFRKFWLRRLFRLYPLYFVALIAAYNFFQYNYDSVYFNYHYFTGREAHFTTTYNPAAYPTFSDLLLHLTFLHGLLPGVNTSILGPAWSLSLEMQFYMLFPLLFLLFFKNGQVVKQRMVQLILFSLVAVIAVEKLFGTWAGGGRIISFQAPSLLFYSLHYFLLGMLLAAYLQGRAKLFHLAAWTLIILPFTGPLTVMTILSIVILLFSGEIKKYAHPGISAVIEGIKRALSGKVGAFGADVSYSLYLIHMIVMPGVIRMVITYAPFGKIANAVIACILFLAANLLISYALYLWIEKPFIALGKRFIKAGWRIPKAAA